MCTFVLTMAMRQTFHTLGSWLIRPLTRQPLWVAAAAVMLASGPYLYMLWVGLMDGWKGFAVYAPLQGLLWAYLLGWIVVACKGNRWVKGVILGLIWLLFVGEGVAVFFASRSLDTSAWFMALETNTREAGLFFGQYGTFGAWTAWILSILVGAALWWIGVYGQWLPTGGRVWRQWVIGVVLIDLLFGVWWIGNMSAGIRIADTNEIEAWKFRRPGNPEYRWAYYWFRHSDLLSKAYYSGLVMRLKAIDEGQWDNVNKKAWLTEAAAPADSLDIVMIVGESYRRSECGLYGGPFDTNPRLSQWRDSGRLVIFANMVTAANYTSGSMRNLFSLNDVGGGERWNECPFFPLIFRRAGYEVTLLDNQSVGAGDGVCGLNQGTVLWNGFVREHAYTCHNDSVYPYDGWFLAAERAPEAARRLVIYHLNGQHLIADQQIPPGSPSRRWRAEDINDNRRPWLDDKAKADMAGYYNASLYNDSIVDAIIRRHAGRPSVVLYFSDHGTDLYDTSNITVRASSFDGQGDEEAWVRRNFEIPFMVWISPQFEARHPAKAAAIRAASARPGMLDNVGNMLFGLAGIRTPYYRAECDILSPSYRPRHRLLSSGHDYDALPHKQ